MTPSAFVAEVFDPSGPWAGTTVLGGDLAEKATWPRK
jgi:hypothetical protein